MADRSKRAFEISKFHVAQLFVKERPVLQNITPEEMNSPFIERDGVFYLNIDAKTNGIPLSIVRHTALRRVEVATKE